jgi:putative endonuclease
VPNKAKPPSECFVYVLGHCARTASGKLRHVTYVGWTNDVAARLAKHNAGKGARSTRGRMWQLLHSESFATKAEAMSREWHLKRERAFRKELASKIAR